MNRLRYVLSLLAGCATMAVAQPPQPPVTGPKKPVPVIHLPPFKPVGVAKYDRAKLKAVPWDLQMVKVPEAWAKNPAAKGKGVRIAILDTGAQVDHPGLNGKVVKTYNAITKTADVADGHGHGTWCVGAVHAVVPDAELVVIKVLSDQGSGAVDVIAHGIDYAVTTAKADVISMSLGGADTDPYMPPAIARAVAAGVVVICAAGNDGGPGDTEGYPGRYPDSISVAACNQAGRLSTFSSWGPNVFTVDPGEQVTGLLPGNREGEMSGTSMATPKEAGKCASWIASNNVARGPNRKDKFRDAVLAASPFKTRTNAVGYGLYTLDKVTGTATAPPAPPTPGKPVVVVIGLADLSAAKQAELAAGGVTTFRLEVGHTVPADLPKVNALPRPTPAPAPVAPPTVISAPVYGQWNPPIARPWYQPIPQPVPMTVPGGCPGGQCPQPIYQPAPQFFPQFQPFGGRFR